MRNFWKLIVVLSLLVTVVSCASAPPYAKFDTSALEMDKGIIHIIPFQERFSDGRRDVNLYVKTDGLDYDKYLENPGSIRGSGKAVVISANKLFSQFGSFVLQEGHNSVLIVRATTYTYSTIESSKSDTVFDAFVMDIVMLPQDELFCVISDPGTKYALVDPVLGKSLISKRAYVPGIYKDVQPGFIAP